MTPITLTIGKYKIYFRIEDCKHGAHYYVGKLNLETFKHEYSKAFDLKEADKAIAYFSEAINAHTVEVEKVG